MEGLAANLGLSLFGTYLAAKMIKEYYPLFIKRNLFGQDLCKATKDKV